MRDWLSYLFMATIFLAACVGMGAISFGLYSFYAPRYTAVDNKIFHESQQYNDGMSRRIAELHRDYVQHPEQRDVIVAAVLHEVGSYDVSKLSPDERTFVYSLRGY